MAINFKKFDSGYTVTDYAFFSPPPYLGKGWKITFEDDLSEERPKTSAHINGITYPGKTVVIHSSSRERAQDVNNLLYASYCLAESGFPPFDRPIASPISRSSSSTPAYEQEGTPFGISIHHFPLVCMIAAKASQRRKYKYALFKLLLSYRILSIEPMALDPSSWTPGKFVHQSAEYHVECAYAIVTAYAVLEELSLEVRASQRNPSMIDGEWNPKVRHNLESRLKQAGVDLSEPFLWELRDTPTKIEQSKQLRALSKAGWAYGKIRDREVALIDAIAYASWLRSKVSAHRLGPLASSLSYYNVFSVQSLARRMLLEVLGYWRYPVSYGPD